MSLLDSIKKVFTIKRLTPEDEAKLSGPLVGVDIGMEPDKAATSLVAIDTETKEISGHQQYSDSYSRQTRVDKRYASLYPHDNDVNDWVKQVTYTYKPMKEWHGIVTVTNNKTVSINHKDLVARTMMIQDGLMPTHHILHVTRKEWQERFDALKPEVKRRMARSFRKQYKRACANVSSNHSMLKPLSGSERKARTLTIWYRHRALDQIMGNRK